MRALRWRRARNVGDPVATAAVTMVAPGRAVFRLTASAPVRSELASSGRPLCRHASGASHSIVQLESGDEHVARHLDAPDRLHLLLALLLLLEQLALARDVAAVALGEDVLAPRLDGLAGDDLRADGGLDRHVV